MSLLTFMLTCSTCIQVAWHHPRILLHHPMQGRLKGEGTLISLVLLFVAVQSGYPVDSLLYQIILYHTISYNIMLYLYHFISIFSTLCKYLQHFCIPADLPNFNRKISMDDNIIQYLICSGPLLVGLVLKRTTNGRTGLNNPHLPPPLVRGIPIIHQAIS